MMSRIAAGRVWAAAKPPAKKPAEPDMTDAARKAGSPDKGAPDTRITPGSGTPSTPAAPVVKPDPAKDPKQPAKPPAKGGSK